MPGQGKVINIIFIIFISATLALAGSVFFLLQKERLRAVELEEKLEDLNKKQVFTEAELTKSKQLITTLQSRLDESKSQMQTLTADLELQKKDSQESRSKMERLNIDLAEQQKLRKDLESKFDLAQEELRKAIVKLESLDSEKETLESKVKELEAKTQEVELGKIIVSPEAGESGVKHYEMPAVSAKAAREPQVLGLQGKVLVVNKEYNFVVINLGAKDGVDIGDEFSVFDDSALIGDIKVEKVHDSMAAAGFLSADIKDKIREGNKVIQKVR